MLTALQERILRVVADLPEATGFALAGGAALIVHGVVERPTEDLDFFSTHGDDVARLVPALEAALGAVGLATSVGHDFRLKPTVRTPLGPVLSEEELGADKMLTLFGRAEERDFVDVFHLAKRLGFDRLCELAAAKDPGFSRYPLAASLARFEGRPREGFEISDDAFAALSQWVRRIRLQLAQPMPERDPPGLSL